MAFITIMRERCKGCGICVENCPQKLISILDSELNALGYRPAGYTGEDGACKGCKICAEMCPDVCIEVYKQSG